MQSGDFYNTGGVILKTKIIAERCKIFNCDKKHGNYCCYYCEIQCNNRCANDPALCGQYTKSQKYIDFCTKYLKGEIEIADNVTLADCIRKLAEYEATKLQPQDIKLRSQRYRNEKAKNN